MKTKEQIDQERLARAKQMAAEVKNGTLVDHRANMEESWFPRRPPIKKNQKLIAQIYGAGKTPKKHD